MAYRRLRQTNRWPTPPGRPPEEKPEAAPFFPAQNTSCAFSPRGKDRILHSHFRENGRNILFGYPKAFFIIGAGHPTLHEIYLDNGKEKKDRVSILDNIVNILLYGSMLAHD